MFFECSIKLKLKKKMVVLKNHIKRALCIKKRIKIEGVRFKRVAEPP